MSYSTACDRYILGLYVKLVSTEQTAWSETTSHLKPFYSGPPSTYLALYITGNVWSLKF